MPPIDPVAPEVAFWGKSNVGKSSLLNALMLKKGLVKTSKTPGHTQLLNQFGVTVNLRRRQRHLTLVDLPGYGFAQMPPAQQRKLQKMLGEYLSGRTALSLLVHLFDLRHEPTSLDVQTWQQVSMLSPARVVVGTKADRVSKSKHRAHAKVIAQALGIATDDVTVFSSEDRTGRAELWGRILAATGVATHDLFEGEETATELPRSDSGDG
jgi:GTP-binding protein